jgi:hypothetical protein
MPHGEMPWVRDGRLLNSDNQRIVVDTPAWFSWLATVSSFCYSSQRSSVRLTVRQEKRGSNLYWYGYSKIDSKLHNVYLGKRQNLDQVRLEEACQEIHQRARERRSPATTVHGFIVTRNR